MSKKSAKKCQLKGYKDKLLWGPEKMKKSNQKGFSLIELLLVVVILGILSAIGVPYLQKAKSAAENTNAISSLRTVAQSQMNYFASKNRFARLDELNTTQNGSLGRTVGTQLLRGNFTFEMPSNPTPEQLQTSYEVIVTKSPISGDTPYVLSLNQRGEITQILP